ncbi:MAG: hypothetical protein HN389_11400 [Clostridia bacterium]|nr:hypothetical protein [Clostridia bacterium]
MRKIFILAKTLLKGGGAFSMSKKRRTKYLIPLVLGLSFAVFGVMMVMLTFEIFDALDSVNQADIILPLVFGATCIMVFIFGVFYVVSTMYHAKDIELLASLPIRPYQMLSAKFITLVVYEYIMEAFILVPVMVAFGVKSGVGVTYIVYCIILLAITPIIALSIASVLVMVVMRFTSFGKNKQVFKFVGSILVVGIAIGLNIGLQALTGGNRSEEQLVQMIESGTSLVSTVSNVFPGIIFASRALINSASISGVINLALFVLCSAGGIAAFLGVGQLVYTKGVAGVTESSAKRKGVSDLGKEAARISATLSYIRKEFRLLVRSPIAFLNCVMMNLIWPAILVVMMFTSGSLEMVKTLLVTMDGGLMIAILVGMSAFVSSSNATASTAISREGKQLYVTKYIPLDMSKQLIAKILTGYFLSVIGIVIIVIVGIVLGMNVGVALIALVLSLLVSAVVAVAGTLIDVSHPKLNWMNEQQAIKQNVNVLLHMLVGLLFGAVAVVPVLFASMTMVVTILYLIAVFGGILIVLVWRVRGRAAARMLDMDA